MPTGIEEAALIAGGIEVAKMLTAVAATAVASKTGYDAYVKNRQSQDGDFIQGFFSDNTHRMSADLPSVKDEAELNDQWGWLWSIGNSMSRVVPPKETLFTPILPFANGNHLGEGQKVSDDLGLNKPKIQPRQGEKIAEELGVGQPLTQPNQPTEMPFKETMIPEDMSRFEKGKSKELQLDTVYQSSNEAPENLEQSILRQDNTKEGFTNMKTVFGMDGKINPLNKNEIIVDTSKGKVGIIAKENESEIKLYNIRALDKNKGAGSEAMRNLTQYADKNGLIIKGTMIVSESGGLDKRQLTKFYKDNGFEVIPGHKTQLIRLPKEGGSLTAEQAVAQGMSAEEYVAKKIKESTPKEMLPEEVPIPEIPNLAPNFKDNNVLYRGMSKAEYDKGGTGQFKSVAPDEAFTYAKGNTEKGGEGVLAQYVNGKISKAFSVNKEGLVTQIFGEPEVVVNKSQLLSEYEAAKAKLSPKEGGDIFSKAKEGLNEINPFNVKDAESAEIDDDKTRKPVYVEFSGSDDTSSAGAKGKWQVMESVVKDYNKKNKTNYDYNKLTDEQNEAIGYWYYNTEIPRLLKKDGLKANEVNKLIVYNSGPAKMKQRITDYSFVKDSKGQTVKETVNYIIKAYDEEFGLDVSNGIDVFNEKRKDALAVQKFLAKKGYYKGKLDNKFGPQSKEAFIKWLESDSVQSR